MRWQRGLARRLPFYYGWLVLGASMCATFARQATAVATLSVFIVPMTSELGWSRAEISGAVTLGGILAALLSPWLGRLVDRHGARLVLVLSSVAIATTALLLAATRSLVSFYLVFSLGRMIFASPFDLGITAAVANWFVRRRATAMAWITVSTGISLAVMPFFAQLAIDASGWRIGWVAVAAVVLIVGALPNALLMVRRPEDLGLSPDGAPRSEPAPQRSRESTRRVRRSEPAFTLAQAKKTRALWLLMLFSAIIFMVQAGISLHQAPHMIERGIDATIAASIVSTFALTAALSGLVFGALGDRLPIRVVLTAAALTTAIGALYMRGVTTAADGYLSAALFGAGIGGVITLVPVSFANYFGRASYGAIRGFALPAQVGGQAMGPLLGGVLFDLSGNYSLALSCFAGAALLAAGVALLARPPRPTAAPTH